MSRPRWPDSHNPPSQIPGTIQIVVERMDAAGAPVADCLVAIDTVDAGAGDRILVLDEGNGARQIFTSTGASVRSVIVGIIDAVTV